MTVQKVFTRSEVKYLVSDKQRELIEHEMLRWMRPDEFGRSTVRSLYYDTPDHLLIRRSLAAPIYKEKLRLRSYKQADETSPVYAEIKKKFDGVVYKRRCRMTNAAAEAYLSGGWQDGPYKNEQEDNTLDAQVMKELHFMLSRYKTLAPAAFVSCEREAFYAVDDHEFRITFDDNILGRDTDLSLTEGIGGLKLLPDGQSLMEIKAGVAVAGAFSLVRFRSAPGSAKEIGTLFLAMGAGLITGMGYLTYAVLFTLVMAGFMYLFDRLTDKKDASRELVVVVPEDLDYTGIFDDLFERYTSEHRLTSVKTSNMGSLFKLRYMVKLKNERDEKSFIDDLRCRNGNLEIAIMEKEESCNEL